MTAMTIRELNGNVSKAIARVQAGETVDITKGGKIVAEIRPKSSAWLDDPVRRSARKTLLALMEKGSPQMSGPLTYEERTER